VREALRWWVFVERCNGAASMEGVIRDDEWLDEPGGADFAVTVMRTNG
jgi:hypothetical protein